MKKHILILPFLIISIFVEAQFGPKQYLSGMNGPTSVFASDLDGDGDMDVLMSSQLNNKVTWRENLGGGGFGPEQTLINGPAGPTQVITADIDGDNDEDVLSAGANGNLIVYINQGNGVFSSGQGFSNMSTISVFAGDIEGDGDIDIIYSNTNKVAWRENLGGGVFASESDITINISGISSVYASDLDGDGSLEVISSSYSDNKIACYKYQGGGIFGSQVILAYASSVYSVFVADLNGDGKNDILSALRGIDKIVWYENLGGGVLGAQQVISTMADGADHVHAVDLDEDGDIDVLSASDFDSKIAWYENLGDGIFGPQNIINNSTSGANDVYAADIDNDGDIDVLSTSHTSDAVFWYENYLYFNTQVKGRIFLDYNQNGINDSIDPGLQLKAIRSTPQSDYAYTYINGFYLKNFSDTIGTYRISPENIPFWNIVTDSLSYTVDIDYSFTSRDSLDFGLYPDSIITSIELELTGGFPRCNQIVNFWVNLKNQGTTIPNGIIHLELDSAISYQSSVVIPDSIIGQNIYWHYDSLFYFSEEMIRVDVKMPSISNIGDTLTSILSIHELDSIKNIIYSNYDTLEQQIRCSYDPNDKTVLPKGIGEEGFITLNTDYLDYLIRFQNTGNDTAITITIKDQLDDNLDWSTVQQITSSHSAQVSMEQDGELIFKFENIMLPDSGVDFLESQGFVKFIIKMNSNLIPGTRVNNEAHIYFDNNPAIITNNVLNTIYDCNKALVNVINSTTCFNEYLEANSPEGNIINYLWEIDSFYSDTSSTLNWLADTIGDFDLKLTIENQFCSKDTITKISILPPLPITNINQFICQGDSLFINGEYQNVSGVYYDTLQNNNGCDSIITTTLGVNPIYLLNKNDSICSGDSLLIYGTYQSSSGIYYDSLQTNNSCDSILSTTLHIKPPPRTNVNKSICLGDSLLIFGNYENTAGIYYDSLQTINGCDSIISTTLYVNLPSSINILPSDSTVCQGDSIQLNLGTFCRYSIEMFDSWGDGWNGQSLTVYDNDKIVGNYTLPTGSIDTINFSIQKGNQLIIVYNSGSYQSESYFTIKNEEGTTLFLMLRYEMTGLLQGDTLFANIANCELNLTDFTYWWTPNTEINDSSIPNPIVSPSATTNYTVSITDTSGCSIDRTLNLVVRSIAATNNNVFICQNDSIMLGGSFQTIEGVYIDSLQTIEGCDSILSTTLTVNPVFSFNQNQSICQGDSILLYGAYQNTAGIYYDSLQSINGCDSILATTLSINQIFSINQNQSICQGDSIFIYGSSQNSAGIYYDSLQTINGCDSILSTTLTVNPIFSFNQNQSICQGDSILIYGSSQNSAGIYYDSLQTFNGCDSILSTTLTVNPIFSFNQNQTICQGDSIFLEGVYQTTNGIYVDSLQTINGCDSIMSTQLVINPLPNVSIADFLLDTICGGGGLVGLPNGTPSGGSYSGIGVSGGNFDPSTAGIGTHNVIYTFTDTNSCMNSDTTMITVELCTGIDGAGNDDFGILIYPNPNTGLFTIEKPNGFNKEVGVRLLDVTSKLIIDKVIPIGIQKIDIDIINYSKGIYYLQLIIDKEIFVKQILKN